jgi:hypothetical protein
MFVAQGGTSYSSFRTFAIIRHEHAFESDIILLLCPLSGEEIFRNDHFEQAYLSLLLEAE